MKKKLLLLTIGCCFSATSFCQILPSYVPTDSLVGWWPFNGNANDESGHAFHGTLSQNGPVLSKDRFGVSNSAYKFDGENDTIYTPFVQKDITELSISAWFNTKVGGPIMIGDHNAHCISLDVNKMPYSGLSTGRITLRADGPSLAIGKWTNRLFLDSSWHHVVGVFQSSPGSIQPENFKIYLDDSLVSCFTNVTLSAISPINNILPVIFGAHPVWTPKAIFNGILDDIGIWKRALSPQEIKNLYNGGICFQSVSVTDTLFINTNITSYNPIKYQNSIKIYPNPTNDHITIDNGNISNLTGYEMKITNSLGQQVFQSPITQQQFYVDLSTWTGNGIYFVHLIDGQGSTLEIKKIVLQ